MLQLLQPPFRLGLLFACNADRPSAPTSHADAVRESQRESNQLVLTKLACRFEIVS